MLALVIGQPLATPLPLSLSYDQISEIWRWAAISLLPRKASQWRPVTITL